MIKAAKILLFALFEKVSEDIQDRGIGFAQEPSWPLCKIQSCNIQACVET